MKMPLFALTALVISSLFTLSLLRPSKGSDHWAWARGAGGTNWTYGSGAAVDDAGNVYVVGFASGEAQFEDQTLSARAESDIFLARYSPQGSLQWVRLYAESGSVAASNVAIGPGGTVIVIGSLSDSDGPGVVQFGDIRLESEHRRRNPDTLLDMPQNAFIAAVDTSGTPRWARLIGSAEDARAERVAIDEDGNVFVTGEFRGTFRGVDLVADKGDAFIAKLSPDGELQWVRSHRGSGGGTGEAVAVAASGNVYVTGMLRRETSEDAPTGQLPYDLFVAKHDPDGNLLWMQRAEGPRTSFGRGIAVDQQNGIYVAGEFRGEVRFGDEVISSPVIPDPRGKFKAFLTRLDLDGNVQWMRQSRGGAGAFADDVAVNADGAAYIVGSFAGEGTSFDGVTLNGKEGALNDMQTFVVKYGRDGAVLLGQQSRGPFPQENRGRGIAVGPGGEAYVTGVFDGETRFGRHRLRIPARNMFVAKLKNEEPPQ
jgi:hypothetical protein